MLENKFFKISELTWNQKKAVSNVIKKRGLDQYIIQSHILILISTVIFGLVLGFYAKGPQLILNSIKIPILYLFTLYITIPIIFVVDVMMDNKITFTQLSTLLLLGFNNMAIVLISFSPLMLFFIITAPDYIFIVILTVVISGFAGYFGIISITENFKQFHKTDTWNPSLLIGGFIIIFVGTQLAWTLRPFFNIIEGFSKPISGNFYVALGNTIGKYPEVSAVLFGIFFIIALMVSLTRLSKPEPEKKSNGVSENINKPLHPQNNRTQNTPETLYPVTPPQPPVPYYPAHVWGVHQALPSENNADK
jgi:hypothetical protein